jgi:hypothetical protein
VQLLFSWDGHTKGMLVPRLKSLFGTQDTVSMPSKSPFLRPKMEAVTETLTNSGK